MVRKRDGMKNTSQPVRTFTAYLQQKIDTIRKRIVYRTKKDFTPSLVETAEKDGTLWLSFSDGETTQELTLPVPRLQDNGNLVIERGHVCRACGTWMIEDREYDYWELMLWALTERVERYFPTSSKRIFIERLLRSFEYGASPIVFRNFQRIIDDLINRLPLVGTDMQSWAMCNRVQILDPEWDTFSPKQALDYQKKLNERMFPWTSLGQSDSGMCNNTLLKKDVRATVPFGLAHHNPRRNLYQTLGMRGDETPTILSATEKILADKGVVRTGWNLMTAFVDMPMNFEDQIIVNERLKHLFITETRSFTCHGTVLADEGDDVYFLYPLSIEPDGTIVRFNIHSDSATVKSIEETQINFNGAKTDVKVITIEFKRLFKDGFKLTNRHGNKGIIFMTDTGTVHDPVRGEVPIDVIVSAQSVMKRKNFGQLFEALSTLLNGPDKEIVIKDDFVAHLKVVKEALVRNGYRKDGTLDITTRWGDFKAVCGWIHWGCIKTPEDQIWTKHDTKQTNSKDLRTAGNKISHIELRALVTIFGKANPIIKEIMEHWQGEEFVFESMKVLDTTRGIEPTLPVVAWSDVCHVNQREGFFHDLAELTGSVADSSMFQYGFYVSLPDDCRYVINRVNDRMFSEEFMLTNDIQESHGTVVLDKIMVPPAFMRKPWKHQSGKYGLSDVAALLNTIVGAIYRFKNKEGTMEQIGRAIYLYLHGMSRMLSTKTGSISNYCMAIRYPNTVKGTAAIGEGLGPNEVEIHEHMARDLKIRDGNFVLVERFPCLGFMSLRVQKVRVSRDPSAKYVIRVSGNSLSSQALDFDGDVLYLMSFHTPQSQEALKNEFENPHPQRAEAYKRASDKKSPCFNEMDLDAYNIEIFTALTAEQSADIIEGLTGIKRGTGTIIALCYNLMRILERSVGYDDANMSVALEVLLDKVANSVFSMKHAGRSLEAECRKAICTADIDQMLDLGFDPEASVVLAETLRRLAQEVGFNPNSLKSYFKRCESEGKSSIVNIIVRRFHKVWFTSRSNLHPVLVLENLETPAEDLSGWLFHYARIKWEENSGKRPNVQQCDVG